MKAVLNEVYGKAAGVTLRYDMIQPLGGEKLPAIVCVHGGGWVSGCKGDMHDVARHFASHGFAVFCPEYRLAPLYPFPAAVEDCRSFVRFLRDELGMEAVGSFGNSAGGHLSTSLAMKNSAGQADASVNVCGLVDLTDPMEQHPSISWDFIGQFMGKPYKGNEAQWIEASPLYHVSAESAPMLVFHGSEDEIVWSKQSRKLEAAMKDAGAECELHILTGEGHAFSEAGFATIMERSIAFFDEHLK